MHAFRDGGVNNLRVRINRGILQQLIYLVLLNLSYRNRLPRNDLQSEFAGSWKFDRKLTVCHSCNRAGRSIRIGSARMSAIRWPEPKKSSS